MVDTKTIQRTVTFVTGFLLILICGSLWGFSVFGPSIKGTLGLTQTEIDNAGSLGDVGNFLAGFTLGKLYDKTGSTITLAVSLVLIVGGYMLMWIQLKGYIPSNWLLLSLFLLIIGQGMNGCFTTGLGENVKSFPPKFRGSITGPMIGAFAISAAFYAQSYSLFFAEDPITHFILYIVCCTGFLLIAMWTVKKVPFEPPKTEDRKPLLVNDNDSAKFSQANESGKVSLKNFAQAPSQPAQSNDITGLGLVKAGRFWLLFAIFFAVTGSGLMFNNQIGSITVSLGKTKNEQDLLVTLYAVGSLTGRVSVGLISDALAKKLSNRAWWFVGCSALMLVVHFLFALFMEDMLYVAAVGSGLASGGTFTNAAVLVSLLFGTKFFGFNIGTISIAPASGTFIYGYIAGALYQRRALPGATNCYGAECWRDSFFITSASCLVALVLSVVFIIVLKRRENRSL